MHINRSALALNSAAEQRPAPQRVDQAARQLESQFTQMLVKCMRDASFGDSLFPQENQTYRDLYDRQLSDMLSQGKGLGLAPLIARQLQGASASEQVPADADKDSPQAASEGIDQSASFRRFLGPQRSNPAAQDSTAIGIPMRSAGLSNATSSQACDDIQQVAETDPSKFPQGSPEHFVAKIWPHARRAAQELGVDPRALVAQAALETGWGRRGIRDGHGGDANNLFGIKATGWKGERVNTTTHEYINGQRRSERADFRSYASPAESFNDYVRLLKTSPRYQQVLQAGTDVRQFATELQRAGYATDPSYARKIHAIANGPTMDRALNALPNNLVANR